MATQKEVIMTFMKALDVHTIKRSNFSSDKEFTTNILDFAVKACSNFGGMQKAINQMLADQKKAGNADTFLKKYCGINLANTDTGAITGKDAGGSKVKTATSIVPETLAVADWTLPKSGSSTTISGLKVNWPTAGVNGKTFTAAEKHVLKGLNSEWIKQALKLAKDSYGIDFNTSGASVKTINIEFENNSTNGRDAATSSTDSNNDGKRDTLTLIVNMYYYGDINTASKDGALKPTSSHSDETWLDRTISHEFIHAIMSANVNYYNYLPSFVKEGLAELVHGIDDDNPSGITKLAGDIDSLKTILSLTDYSTIKIKGISNSSYAGGYMFMRYLAKQAANGGTYAYNKSVSGTSGKDSINNFFSGSKIQAVSGNDTIRNYASSVTIDAGAGNDKVVNEGSKVSIYGGNDADYIYNDSLASNVSIIAGTGADSIFNHATSVTIEAGNDADYISNFKSKVSIYGGSGNDSLYNSTGGSNVTLEGGNDADYISNKGSKVLILGGAGADTIRNEGGNVTINCGNGNDSVRNYASSKVTIQGGNGADHIANYGAAASIIGGNGNDSLYGDKGNDTILGGANNDKLYGYAGNDKLYGGTGNDSLWGNAGSDTFIYAQGDGKDVIFGFESADLLQITGAFSGTCSKSKKEIYFDVGTTKNAITLKDFGSTSTFNVNGVNYKISGTKLVKK